MFLALVAIGPSCVRPPIPEFLAEGRRSLRIAESDHRLVAETPLSRKWDVRLRSADGRELEFFLREPRERRHRVPAVLILAGFETGRESLDLISERSDAVLMSMNYPYEGPDPPLRGLRLVRALPALRRSAFETLEGGLLALEYLDGRSDVDRERTILVGVSFGSPFVTALAAHDPRPDAAVLIYGGGDLRGIAAHNVRSRWIPRPLARFVIGLFFGDLEPLRHVADVSPRFLLMANSTRDELVPEWAARLLFDRAREPKKLLWRDTGHMDLFDREVLADLTADVVTELRAAGYMDRREGVSR